jgi:hypothetical protein
LNECFYEGAGDRSDKEYEAKESNRQVGFYGGVVSGGDAGVGTGFDGTLLEDVA